MSVDIFDKYDIRARICAMLFVIAPMLLDGYVMIDAFRNITFTILLASLILAYSCLFSCWIRFFGNKMDLKDYIVEFLMLDSKELSQKCLKRYYEKLSKLEPSFSDLLDYDKKKSQKILKDVSSWLRQKTRDEKFSLVREENINYGFIRNIYSLKKFFLIVFSLYSLLLVVLFGISVYSSSFEDVLSAKVWVCLIIHLLSYGIWIFGVTKKIFDFVARKYAREIVAAIDRL